jgi:hypothetical protein
LTFPAGDRRAQEWAGAAQAWAKTGTPAVRAAIPSVKALFSGSVPALSRAGAPKSWRIAANAGALPAKAWAEAVTSWAGAGAMEIDGYTP